MSDVMVRETTDTPASAPAKLSVLTLAGMVVGGMVGAGVFSLPARFAVATGVFGSLIAWAVAGTGMLMLAFVFQNLAIRKPDLDSGVFIYAKAGFGDYVGFNSAIGFWSSAVAGNAFYWVFITATLGAFFPAFGDGDTVLAVAVSTVGVWFFHYLIARGVRDAAIINRIVTILKVLPILVFIVVLFIAFDAGIFADNWTATGYDPRWLFRTITRTRAYQSQLSAAPSSDSTTPPGYCPIRLRPEALLDKIVERRKKELLGEKDDLDWD